MFRRSRRALALGAAVALTLAPAAAQKAGDAEGADISGVWWASNYSPGIRPLDGALPFTAKGKAAYEKTVAGLKNGSIEDKSRTLCLPDGVPRILQTPYPFQIVQTRGQVTIVYEQNHEIRLIDMAHPLEPDETLAALPYYDGHSAGHWAGDTLVIDTAGFNDKTFLDAFGAPHSDAMRVTERVRKLGNRLEIVATVTDPENYTQPWSARFVYDAHPEVRLQDYVCGEKHRELARVAGVKGF